MFRHVPNLADLGSISCVCRSWRDELRSARSHVLWRGVWDARAQHGRHSGTLGLEAGASWRAQVAACELLAAPDARVFKTSLPPTSRCVDRDATVPRDFVEGWSGSASVDSLGKATCVHAFNRGPLVLVGFESGLASFRPPKPLFAAAADHVPRRPRAGEACAGNAAVDVERSASLGGIVMFAKDAKGEAARVFAATTTQRVVAIDVDLSAPYAEFSQPPGKASCAAPGPETARQKLQRLKMARPARRRRRRLITWRNLDNFEMTDGHIVSLVVPDDRVHVLAGFSNGHIRVISTETAQLVHVLSMRESVDILSVSAHWVVASNFGNHPCPTAWDRRDGRAIHRWERSSVGFEEVAQIVSLAPTSRKDCFAVWDGSKALRLLDVRTGRFTQNIATRGRVSQVSRNAKDEAEYGAAAPQAGPCKMVLTPDMRHAFVAASNRVMLVNVHTSSELERSMTMRQLDDARRSLIHVSTDARYVVTGESNPFGGLGSRFVSSAAGHAPRICVWDVATGKLVREIFVGVGICDVSVANNVIAVVGSGRKNSAGRPCGEALIFQFDV